MNFILYISFSTIFLMQSMGPTMDLCCELQKLPVFIEHYQEQAQHDGTSFVEFVDFHYGDEQETQDHHHDDEHDKNLPFHGHHQCSHSSVFIAPLLSQTELFAFNFFIPSTVSPYSFPLGSEYSESPFQPPKA